jgi:ABC transporter substrate binding protein
MTSSRRELIALPASTAAVSWPVSTHGQQSKIARIGILYIGTADVEDIKKGLREGMRDFGYVRLKVDVIVAVYVPPSLAAKQATRDIPIVVIVGDPVETGIVPSLTHPGSNITGVSIVVTDITKEKAARC